VGTSRVLHGGIAVYYWYADMHHEGVHDCRN